MTRATKYAEKLYVELLISQKLLKQKYFKECCFPYLKNSALITFGVLGAKL